MELRTKADVVEEEDSLADEMAEADILADAVVAVVDLADVSIVMLSMVSISLMLIKASVMRNGSILDVMVGIVYSASMDIWLDVAEEVMLVT